MTKRKLTDIRKSAERFLEILKRDYHADGLTIDMVLERFSHAHEILSEYVNKEYALSDAQEKEKTLNELEDLFFGLAEYLAIENAKKCKPMPTGSSIRTIIDVMDAGQDGKKGIEALPERKNKISHTKYSVTHGDALMGDKGKLIIQHTLSRERGFVRLKIPDTVIYELMGYSIKVKKVLAFVLEKINEQAFHDGRLTRDFITFSAKELIERGVYKTYNSAMTGLKAAMNILTDIKMEGEYRFKKNDTVIYAPKSEGGNVFRYWTCEKGQWELRLEGQADWRFILQAFSILPNYYYILPNRASELLYLIFSMARQHTDDIKQRGHFSVSFRVIQQALHLPDEDKTKNPQRDIKDAINNAIDEIDKAQRANFGEQELLFLSAEYDDAWPITQFLNEGYLHVALSGTFAEPFISIEDEKIKGLKEAKHRKKKTSENKSNNEK